jgi:hypothetical protein
MNVTTLTFAWFYKSAGSTPDTYSIDRYKFDFRSLSDSEHKEEAFRCATLLIEEPPEGLDIMRADGSVLHVLVFSKNMTVAQVEEELQLWGMCFETPVQTGPKFRDTLLYRSTVRLVGYNRYDKVS